MNNEVGLTCLYKDGAAEIFEGDDVAEKMKQGWKDHPAKPRGRPKNGDSTPNKGD